MPLPSVLLHPFFHPSLSTETLRPPPTHYLENLEVSHGSASCRRISLDINKRNHERHAPVARQNSDAMPQWLPYRMPSTLVTHMISQPTVSRVVSRPRLDSSSSVATASGIRDAWTKLTKRQQLGKDPDLLELKTSGGANGGDRDIKQQKGQGRRKVLVEVGNCRRPSIHFTRSTRPCVETLSTDEGRRNHQGNLVSGLLSPPGTHYSDGGGAPDPSSRSPPPFGFPPDPTPCKLDARPRSSAHITEPPLINETATPVPRTNIPKCFQVPPLFPQTHKIACGQIVVMASRCLLVDLREGERRVGGRGNFVLCINPDGREVSKVCELRACAECSSDQSLRCSAS